MVYQLDEESDLSDVQETLYKQMNLESENLAICHDKQVTSEKFYN
jgi:hypothetical protein